MKKRTYWLIFCSCIIGMAISAVLTFIGAWKFGETFEDSSVYPYLIAVPLNLLSMTILVLLIVRKKPIEKASK